MFNNYDNFIEGYENTITSNYISAHEIITVDSTTSRKFEFSLIFRKAKYLPSTDLLPNNTGEGFFRNLDLDSAPIQAKPFTGTMKGAIAELKKMSEALDEDHYGYIIFAGKKRPSEMDTLKTDIDKIHNHLAKVA